MQGEHDRPAFSVAAFSTGERIGWLMRRQGRKPGELARAVGSDATSFWRYRRDERPIPGNVLKVLADELKTSTDFLLCRTDDPRPYPGGSATARKLGRPGRVMPRRAEDLILSASG